MRFHLTPVRMARINKTDDSHAGGHAELGTHPASAGENASLKGLFENHGGVSKGRENQSSPRSSCITHGHKAQDSSPKHRAIPQTCSLMLSLFITARNLKKPRCPSTEELIKKI